jgi:phenylpyruvate tautomerase
MPLLSILTTAEPSSERRAQLLSGLSRVLARELEKPESYVLVSFARPMAMSFGADASRPACYAELKNVGTLTPERCEQLSAILCRELSGGLDVPADRIYVEFTNADGALWGWNGTTFA